MTYAIHSKKLKSAAGDVYLAGIAITAMEEGESMSTWSRLENPVSLGPDVIIDADAIASPLTPPPPADSPISRRRPTSPPPQQGSNDYPNDVHSKGRALLGCLPPKIIERILYIVDANSFASLALLNSEWWRVSNLPELYRYHLHSCINAGLVNNGNVQYPWESEDLWTLKRRFAREARRNLFDSFLRPQKTLVNLISASTSSSSAFPQGEAFRFTFSANGRQLLALSSSRICVIDLSTEPISVSYELKTLRRPVAATILDNASLLAVVSSKHQANIYRLLNDNVKLIQSITLDNVPRTISLSPEGTVLAIAYDGGIEVHALGERALATDRRAVRCFDIDMLSFSGDGLMLVGSSNNPLEARMVSISPPLYVDPDSELPSPELQSRMWTTQMLSPHITIGYNNTALIPSKVAGESATWVVGYDTQLQVFRLGQIDDPRAGFTYFVGPGGDGQVKEPGPSFVPTASCNGELLVLGFQGSGIWLYGIPDVSDRPSTSNVTVERDWGYHQARTNSQRLNKVIAPPSHLVHGRSLPSMDDIAITKWVDSAKQGTPGKQGFQRLVAAAPGGVSPLFGGMGSDHLPVDGGRIVIYDFARSPTDGKTVNVTIEVGEAKPIPLPERDSTLDVEVELERRRTQVNRRGGLGQNRNAVIERSATLARHRASIGSTHVEPTTPTRVHRNSISQPSSPTDPNLVADFQTVDSTYSNTQPRSQDILSRAATAAAANRGRHRYQNARYPQSVASTNRRLLIPHESDADNWVPPPPPYTPNADGPLPEHIQRTLLPSMTEPLPQGNNMNHRQQLRRTQTSRLESMTHSAMQRTRSTMERISAPKPRPRRSPASGDDNPFRENIFLPEPPNDRAVVPEGVPQMVSPSLDWPAPRPARRLDNYPSAPPGLIEDSSAGFSHFSVLPQRLSINTQVPTTSPESTPSGFAHVTSAENSSGRPSALSGSALQERLERPTPPTPIDSSQSNAMPARSTDRNGPTHHLVHGPHALPSPSTSEPHIVMRQVNNATAAPQNFIAGRIDSREPNANIFRPEQSESSRPSHSGSGNRRNSPPRAGRSNSSPTITKPQAISTPHLQSNELRRMETIYSIRPNHQVHRSRPRSQDMPRRKPVAGGTFFDRHTGRIISGSQSDAGVGQLARTEDMRERVTEWSQANAEKKKKRDSRCSIM
ncbi:hypothetical protein AJ79_07703 [Helicocarpus griseus UAMH5409]|uniref:F-box domain-containing protein n=1 Tax=Helicocarpus griseus UAMH5409 TaxID=1447875 RepID=A0A2B7X016_9EURO|nr:hypothetical protein AJ79_07703 [Helicocarpus griseus UAMH5409]